LVFDPGAAGDRRGREAHRGGPPLPMEVDQGFQTDGADGVAYRYALPK